MARANTSGGFNPNDPDDLWKRVSMGGVDDDTLGSSDSPEMLPHDRPIGDFPASSADFSSTPLSERPTTPLPVSDESKELEPRSNPNPTATGGKSTESAGGGHPQAQTLEDYITSAPAEAKAAAAAKSTRLRPSDDDLPDIKTMPGYQRMTDLQGKLDKAQAKPTLKQRLLRMAVTFAPVALGAAFGGLEGAGSAASGVNSEIDSENKQHSHDVDDLMREVDQSHHEVDSQYGHILHSRDIAANRESTAAMRQSVIEGQNARNAENEKGRNNRADTRSETALRLHGLDANGDPIAEDQLSASDRLKMEHTRNQDELTNATVAYRKAQTDAIPEQLKISKARLDNARQALSQSAQRLALAARGLDLREEGLDYRETGPTAATKTKVEQASAINDVGAELIKTIRAHAKVLGPVSGRVTNLEELWGSLPPEAARVAGFQGSFAALQPGLHQMRGQRAMQDFEKRLQIGSFKTNAEAMEAGVQAAIDSANTMKKAWSKGFKSTVGDRRKARNQSNTPGGDDVIEFETDPISGKPVRKSKGGK